MIESEGTSAKRRQGPKRSEASRMAILESTRVELAETGWRSFSVDSVAKRAQASKQTIYRWWESIGSMCVESAMGIIPDAPTDVRDPGQRIAALIVPIEAASRIGNGKDILRGALMAVGDDDLAGEKWRAWMKRDIREPLRMVLAELAAKQVIRRDWDIDAAIEFLLGPFWHKLIMNHSMIPAGFSAVQARRLLKVWAV